MPVIWRSWLKDQRIDHVRGAPLRPQTQGKIERWHQTLKNRILLENCYLPSDLEARIGDFVAHYNHLRYHESIANLTRADVYFGRGQTILLEEKGSKDRPSKTNACNITPTPDTINQQMPARSSIRSPRHSQESLRALARRYGINQKTVGKWRNRSSVADLPTGPKEPRSTVLSIEEEAIIVAFRRHTLLPLVC